MEYSVVEVADADKRSEAAWEDLLVSHVLKHVQVLAPQRGTELILQIMKGRAWMAERIGRLGLKNFVMPKFGIVVSTSRPEWEENKRLSYVDTENEMFLHAVQFALETLLPPNFRYNNVSRREKKIFMRATLDEYYFLGGVHETDHARYTQQNDPECKRGDRLDPTEVGLVAYDAQPHEFEAMQAELEAAIGCNLHPEIVFFMGKRIEMARVFQQKHS